MRPGSEGCTITMVRIANVERNQQKNRVPISRLPILMVGLVAALTAGWSYVGSVATHADTATTTGQSISLSQSVDRTEMRFEDTLGFEITVRWQGSPIAYRFEHALRLKSDQLKVASFSSTVSSDGAGPTETTTKKLMYKLAPVLSGQATIDPVAVEYVSWPDSIPGMLMTDPVHVTVAAPSPKAQTGDGVSNLWIALTAVLVIGIPAAVVGILRRRRGKAVEPKKTPREKVLDTLAELRRDAGNDLNRFQTGLHRLLLDYIAERYGLEVSRREIAQIGEELAGVEKNEQVCEKLIGLADPRRSRRSTCRSPRRRAR